MVVLDFGDIDIFVVSIGCDLEYGVSELGSAGSAAPCSELWSDNSCGSRPCLECCLSWLWRIVSRYCILKILDLVLSRKRTVSTWVLVVMRPLCFGEVRAARATVFLCFGGWHLDVFLDASLDETCDFAPWLLATPAAGADHGNSSSPSALLQLCPGRQDGPWQLGEGSRRFRLTSPKSGVMMGDLIAYLACGVRLVNLYAHGTSVGHECPQVPAICVNTLKVTGFWSIATWLWLNVRPKMSQN